MKFCTHCGTQLPDDAHFCVTCGTSIQPSNPDAAQPTPPQVPPPQQAAAMSSPAPQRKKLSGCAIAAIVAGSLALLLAVLGVVAIVLANYMTSDMVKAANDFLATLKQGQPRAAYEMSASGLREATSLSEFNQVVKGYPILSQHTVFSINTRTVENDQGYIQGEMTDANGQKAEVEFRLIKENGSWKVLALHVKMLVVSWLPSRPTAIQPLPA